MVDDCYTQCTGNSFLGQIKNLGALGTLYEEVVQKHQEVVDLSDEMRLCCDEFRPAYSVILDARDIVVQDKEIIDALTVENRTLRDEIEALVTAAQVAANTAESVVIPDEATYSMECIDGMMCNFAVMILEGKATASGIKIEGLN